MKWLDAGVRKIKTDKVDELGNIIPYTSDEDERTIKARLTQWTSEDVNLYGRDLTNSTRKLITPSKYITQDNIIVVDDILYEIVRIERLDRFTFLIIKEFEIWQNSK